MLTLQCSAAFTAANHGNFHFALGQDDRSAQLQGRSRSAIAILCCLQLPAAARSCVFRAGDMIGWAHEGQVGLTAVFTAAAAPCGEPLLQL